jgi:NADP-dependent 3-hydroxy acid dehydrogenase YdfG
MTTEPNTMTKKEKSPVGRVEGKTALVAGASRGIGRSIALELAREGAKVAINYSSSDAKAKEVAKEIQKLGGTAILCKADIGNSKEVRAMVQKVAEEFTHLDILVNNAGITRDPFLPRMTDEQWVQVIQTNLSGCFYCISAVIPIMTAQSYGRIVNVSSMNGQAPAMGQANYSASKGGSSPLPGPPRWSWSIRALRSTPYRPAIRKPTCSTPCRRPCRPSSRVRSQWVASLTLRKLPKRCSSWWRTAIT